MYLIIVHSCFMGELTSLLIQPYRLAPSSFAYIPITGTFGLHAAIKLATNSYATSPTTHTQTHKHIHIHVPGTCLVIRANNSTVPLWLSRGGLYSLLPRSHFSERYLNPFIWHTLLFLLSISIPSKQRTLSKWGIFNC